MVEPKCGPHWKAGVWRRARWRRWGVALFIYRHSIHEIDVVFSALRSTQLGPKDTRARVQRYTALGNTTKLLPRTKTESNWRTVPLWERVCKKSRMPKVYSLHNRTIFVVSLYFQLLRMSPWAWARCSPTPTFSENWPPILVHRNILLILHLFRR